MTITTASSPVATVVTTVAQADTKNTLEDDYKLLQGTWQSDEDGKYLLLFKDRKTYDLYIGEKDTTAVDFILSSTSCNEGTNADSIKKREGKPPLFLVKKDKDGDMCYEVMTLTEDQLSLIYLDRGNILSFKKKR